jgi:hypothetical protein
LKQVRAETVPATAKSAADYRCLGARRKQQRRLIMLRRGTRGRGARNDGRATTSATSSSVWRQDTVGKSMPVARRDGEKALPDARGAQGSAGPKGARNGNYKNGRYTAEMMRLVGG